MKLLLTSGGLMNKSMVKALDDLMGIPRSQFRIAFIPTAANVEAGDKGNWLVKDYEYFCNLKPVVFDIVDISAIPRDIWQPRLESANMLVFGGGNTFHLMYWLEKSGLKNLLPGLLKTRVYVGISAGSQVAAKNLSIDQSARDYSETYGILEIDEGLGFVDFHIRPHLNSSYFPKIRKPYLEKIAKKFTESFYALDDQSAIKVDGDKIEVVSEGEYLVLNQGKEEYGR